MTTCSTPFRRSLNTINGRWRFSDELGRIPCGERGVEIMIGRKWVRFVELATGRRSRLSRSRYEQVKDARLLRIRRRVA
jgi:hypothetical protein